MSAAAESGQCGDGPGPPSTAALRNRFDPLEFRVGAACPRRAHPDTARYHRAGLRYLSALISR
jgi:hypothetical protein